MSQSVSRRAALLATLLAAPALALPGDSATAAGDDAAQQLAGLEARTGGRLGVAALDLGTGRRIAHRADERFPMCSTFKVLAAACVLARVDRKEERLDRSIALAQQDLVTYSPAAKERAGGRGMTLAELCGAAITLSDNTAANLLLASFGGPAGLTAFVRSLGDPVTRLDRIEPDLNEATPGDPRDTTSPAAMMETLRRLVLGDALSAPSRGRLAAWLVANKTGDARLRAGLPRDWRVGDKTGTGENGVANDIAVAWPPGRAPVVVSAYFAESRLAANDRSAVLAEVARIVSAGR
jgi:beta-lactamase class A